MRKITLSLTILLTIFISCTNDDDQILPQENDNGFFINSDFQKVNKAYYIPDLTTEEAGDFFIVVTDGEIISPLTDSNDFLFSDTTTNSVIFRGIQDSNTPTALNFPPNGSYTLNSNNESFSSAHFNFNCESSNGVLQMCQYLVILDETEVPNIAVIDIEHEELTENYTINYNIELSNSIIINGRFHGLLDLLESE
jgi:hypothetical protein